MHLSLSAAHVFQFASGTKRQGNNYSFTFSSWISLYKYFSLYKKKKRKNSCLSVTCNSLQIWHKCNKIQILKLLCVLLGMQRHFKMVNDVEETKPAHSGIKKNKYINI